jgi:hypothetical protein
LLALISGLLGAVITAIFNYFINIKLINRTHKIREQQTAYVYLVKVSLVIAAEIFIKSELKSFMEKAGLTKSGEDFFGIAMCAVLAEGINKLELENLEEIKKFLRKAETEKIFDEFFDYKISDELLAEFPRTAVVNYSLFSGYASGTKSIIAIWFAWARTGDSTLLTAENIYNQWMTIKNFFASAKALRDILIEKGNVSDKDAMELVNKQLEEIKKGSAEITSAKPKLEAALTSLREEMEKKKATTAEQLLA